MAFLEKKSISFPQDPLWLSPLIPSNEESNFSKFPSWKVILYLLSSINSK